MIYRMNFITDMHRKSYRLLSLVMITAISWFTVSCGKAPQTIPPAISFSTGTGYVSHDTVIATGEKVRIGIRATTSNANITYFSIRFSEGKEQILLDSGMNTPALNYYLDVIKTSAPSETWTFLIMDRNRTQRSISLKLTKAEVSKWGKIRTIHGIVLGASENTTTGSFYSLSENRVMNLHEAFLNQSLTDIVYYYGQYEGTLASPNEAEAPGFFTGPEGISNWTVKNETRYDTTRIVPEEFDASFNDSLILSAYEPTAGKKKGKFVTPGMVLSFKSPAGKLGLIKIGEVIPLPSGSVNMTIKIQE